MAGEFTRRKTARRTSDAGSWLNHNARQLRGQRRLESRGARVGISAGGIFDRRVQTYEILGKSARQMDSGNREGWFFYLPLEGLYLFEFRAVCRRFGL